ncbi:retrovirus-related pol polyprotein from transposon TNT 1-94 [Tanacetum coccineum]
MSRAMLAEQSIPQKFWCHALDTATYIFNRVYIRKLINKTPYEILRNRKPSLEYIRVFGCKVFILNTKVHLTKFDLKSYEEDDRINEPIVQDLNGSPSLQVNVSDEGYPKSIKCQIVDNCKKGLGYEKYNAVPPPYTGNFMPPIHDLSFTGLDEFVNKFIVENRKFDEEVSKVVRKFDDSPIIEDWVSDSEEENVSQTKTEKKTVKPSIAKIQFVKPKQQEKTVK